MKHFKSPFTISGPALAKAKLLRSTPDGEYPLTIVNNADDTSTLSTTAALPGAVLRLILTPVDEACCCREMLVYTDGCPPSLIKGKHTGGNPNNNGPVPSCDPEEPEPPIAP